MLPDRVSNPGPLTYESGALPIALRGPAAPNVNDPHVHKNSLSLISSDSCAMSLQKPDPDCTARQYKCTIYLTYTL